MNTGSSSLEEAAWRSAVAVREDSALATELRHRWDAVVPRPSVSVTDLIAPRRAFWRARVGPVPPTPERQARLDAGRRVHRVLERLLAREAALEVRVRREGIVGRIDALTDRPIEFKTTTTAPPTDQLVEERPEYIEQLALYCALADRPVGRLIAVAQEGSPADRMRTWDVRFRDPGGLSQEMRRRGEVLRAAIVSGQPSQLPRCRWFDRGCEYRAIGACDCSGTESGEVSDLGLQRAEVTGRADVDQLLGARLAEELRSAPVSRFARFRDLVYPRRTFYERTRPVEETGSGEGPSAPLSTPYEHLLEAIESGPVGEVARLPTLSDEPEEEVPALRGVPYLARTSRSFVQPRAEEMLARTPQYALELGFRCASTGTRVGRVILAHEKSSDPDEQLKVFEFRFDPITTFSRLWRSRASQLESALASGSPGDLPACPAWMFASCAYREVCGCGPVSGRSQR